MKTPVIIAAHNEADYIGRTLASLDQNEVEPIVVVNGSTDETADIAKGYGATVYELPEPGKLPALQHAVGRLSREAACDTLLFTDADSKPFMPRHWHKIMARAVQSSMPTSATGPIGYIDGKLQDRLMNSYSLMRAAIDGRRNDRPFTTGNNLAVRFCNPSVLDKFMEMPHIWPREDEALAKLIKDSGGDTLQLISVRSIILTSTRQAISFNARCTLGAEEARRQHFEKYIERAAPGSRRYRPTSKLGY